MRRERKGGRTGPPEGKEVDDLLESLGEIFGLPLLCVRVTSQTHSQYHVALAASTSNVLGCARRHWPGVSGTSTAGTVLAVVFRYVCVYLCVD